MPIAVRNQRGQIASINHLLHSYKNPQITESRSNLISPKMSIKKDKKTRSFLRTHSSRPILLDTPTPHTQFVCMSS
ncbi:hypothetical protein L596_015869 [Steinernema carpocapsae]|uniref:Uncharacterized protein n=1 Tax=Steinernema carpocapsae TaxID=34508 RepID=A0A4U5NH39_STECR|nr:hypothetical protein L596_015869 [Steinernema carpocapsae]